MKHTVFRLLVFSLVFVISSCLSSHLNLEEDAESSGSVSEEYRVTLDMARSFAASFKERGPIRSEECFSFRGDTLLYLFNYKDGWIVVSSDTRTSPIVASNESGQLSFKQISNSKTSIWFNGIAEEILALRYDDQAYKTRSSDDFWAAYKIPHNRDSLPEYPCWMMKTNNQTVDILTESIGPLIQTKWGQKFPWNNEMFYGYDSNNQMEKCILGCASVAMSQILYYTHFFLGKPNGLFHDVSVYGLKYSVNSGEQGIVRDNYYSNSTRWNDMAETDSDSHIDYVRDFIMDVGFTIGTKYWVEESPVQNYSASSFSNYGILCEERTYNADTVHHYLSLGLPSLITAARIKNNYLFFNTYDKYHVWIIDGWRSHHYTTYQTHQWILLNSEDDLLNYVLDGTEAFYDYDTGLQENGGNQYTYNSFSTYATNLLMNWGANGQFDSTEYYTNPVFWSAGDKLFQYDAHIYCNFR